MTTSAGCLCVVACCLLVASVHGAGIAAHNLTCYQCHMTTNDECGKESLLPCPPSKDRCVTNIMKDPKNGFVIKRECGLGPCGFEDEMMNRGLGLEGCDRTKNEFFCLSCCKEDGCNKALGSSFAPALWLLVTVLLLNVPIF